MKKQENHKMFWEGIFMGLAIGIIGNVFVTSAFNLITINKYFWNFVFLIISFLMLLFMIFFISKMLRRLK